MKVFDVWAEWCPPCKRFAPIFESVSKKFPDVEFIKIEADQNSDFLDEYSISSIPTLLIEKNGEVVFRHVGILTEANLESAVASCYRWPDTGLI